MCTRQSRKVMWDILDTLFLTLYPWNLLLLLSLSTRKHTSMVSCHFFFFFWRTVNSKPPTIPFGIVACTLSDNLSRNSCIYSRLGVIKPSFLLIYFRYGSNTRSYCTIGWHRTYAIWSSTFEIGATQLRSVTEIAPKSPFLRVNGNPIRYAFRAGAKSVGYP